MSLFKIAPHTISASHIRGYPRGSTSAAINPPQLKLIINQYIPDSHLCSPPSPGDLTIIFCHANGFHKELYEPFFDELLSCYEKSGLRIRSIWAPDAVHQGASGVLNESILGDEPSWDDLSRDLLHMVNTFSAEMQPPLVGMGHSFGGHAVTRLALIHPSLFTSLVLLDPVIEVDEYYPPSFPSTQHPAQATAKRRDIWPSLEEAEKFLRSRPFYKSWDPRVLNLHIKYGLRPLPTVTYPDKTGVTLTTSKHQEVYTYLRSGPEFQLPAQLGRPEPGITFRHLKYLNPPVLYITGGKSPVSRPPINERKMENTPVAEMKVIEECGHLIPFEAPILSAELAAAYLITRIKIWGKEAEKDLETPRLRHLSEDLLKRLAKL